MPEFTRYAPPAGSFIRTAQLGTTREWVEPFMAQIEPYLANARQQSNYMPLGVAYALLGGAICTAAVLATHVEYLCGARVWRCHSRFYFAR